MYAIIKTGGKQIKAEAGRFIDVEKLPQNEGEKVSLDSIVMLVSGQDSKIGSPFVKGATVNGLILKNSKDGKVIVFKMRPKKGTRKKQGHRQHYTRLFIESIELDGKVMAKAESAPKEGLGIKRTRTVLSKKVVSEPKVKKTKSKKVSKVK
jgi:large subunit ribosomal protein L21